ncbi:hypothetical protein ACGFKX_21705 [Pseudonocardia alni]|uniref:hypothetical protein n=1 Tax=Pseudonocardia alni TaxID=33907 RepID=UPI00370FB498
MSTEDVMRLRIAADQLTIAPRPARWTHLALCVIDAVWSINANYDTVVVPICRAYAAERELPDPLLPSDRVNEVIGTTAERQLDELVADIRNRGVDWFIANVGNRQWTSTGGHRVRKADAVLRYAEILTGHGVHTLTHAAAVINDTQRRTAIETALRAVPGHGRGIRLGYLWMLAGDDRTIKPDRMVLRWMHATIGRTPGIDEARKLTGEVARQSGVTPWELDHAIWSATTPGRR